jgi:hypothetical protein
MILAGAAGVQPDGPSVRAGPGELGPPSGIAYVQTDLDGCSERGGGWEALRAGPQAAHARRNIKPISCAVSVRNRTGGSSRTRRSSPMRARPSARLPRRLICEDAAPPQPLSERTRVCCGERSPGTAPPSSAASLPGRARSDSTRICPSAVRSSMAHPARGSDLKPLTTRSLFARRRRSCGSHASRSGVTESCSAAKPACSVASRSSTASTSGRSPTSRGSARSGAAVLAGGGRARARG